MARSPLNKSQDFHSCFYPKQNSCIYTAIIPKKELSAIFIFFSGAILQTIKMGETKYSDMLRLEKIRSLPLEPEPDRASRFLLHLALLSLSLLHSPSHWLQSSRCQEQDESPCTCQSCLFGRPQSFCLVDLPIAHIRSLQQLASHRRVSYQVARAGTFIVRSVAEWTSHVHRVYGPGPTKKGFRPQIFLARKPFSFLYCLSYKNTR